LRLIPDQDPERDRSGAILSPAVVALDRTRVPGPDGFSFAIAALSRRR
jgi:hypothetical protein